MLYFDTLIRKKETEKKKNKKGNRKRGWEKGSTMIVNKDSSQAIPRLIERYYEQVLELTQGNSDSRNTNTNRSEKDGLLLGLRRRVLDMAIRMLRKVVNYNNVPTDNNVHGGIQRKIDNDNFQDGLVNTEHPGILEAVEEAEQEQEQEKQAVPFGNGGKSTEKKLATTSWLWKD